MPQPDWADGWQASIEDELLLSRYGWTLDYVDSLSPDERGRLRDMWMVRSISQQADAFLADWQRKQGMGMQAMENMRATVHAQRETTG